MRKQLDFLVLISYCSLIYWLSAQSVLPGTDLFENEDKLQHFLAYAIMGICAWRVLRHFMHNSLLLMILSFGFCSLYGLSDEWHQSFVMGRTPSSMDWLADSFGGLLASIACGWQHKKTI
ncbi:VanZ family protein [Methylomonas sp. AM2-LC]|uniref:VanZ family protein n=1 Tax=Methylomonas sp. AM2-LC TaxID=3153301 RepID=UPI0032655459